MRLRIIRDVVAYNGEEPVYSDRLQQLSRNELNSQDNGRWVDVLIISRADAKARDSKEGVENYL